MLQDPLNVYSTLPGLSLDGLGPRYVRFKNTSGDYGAGLMFSAFLELYPKKNDTWKMPKLYSAYSL